MMFPHPSPSALAFRHCTSIQPSPDYSTTAPAPNVPRHKLTPSLRSYQGQVVPRGYRQEGGEEHGRGPC
ncbi:hypothetical protein IMZ48_15135 [Candidatus Bathyarchaeota archaeon]|nr:hypothetical protein [Candidatus Bathyarchaeota archaeon]